MKREEWQSYEDYVQNRREHNKWMKERLRGLPVWYSNGVPYLDPKTGEFVRWIIVPQKTLVLKNVPDDRFIPGCPKKARYLKVA